MVHWLGYEPLEHSPLGGTAEVKNHTPEKDQIDQEDGDDEDAGDQEIDQTSDLTYYQLAQDRELRTRTKPLRFRDESNMAAYAFVAAEEEDTHEPLTYQEAVACEDSSKWKNAMKEEMDSLRKNKTWELVDHPAGKKLMSYKWLFKIKGGIEGVQNPRFKARLVARGFTQRAGIDCNEVFSLVVRHISIRVILALTACKDYELEQLDVKTTFLHGNLEEVIYMRQPSGDEQGNKVCLLKKSLYGLKQSPRQGYKRSYAPELGEAKKFLDGDCQGSDVARCIRVTHSGMCCKPEGNATTRGGSFNYKDGVYDPYGGCEASYLAKVTLGRVGRRA
ncbi:retrotransposon protein, putative, ty1-copia subclass [Tanacetum coccineum]